MPSERVLICGAGIAGSVLAFWLARYNYQVVVVERSKSEQNLGQGLEIEQPAFKVVEAMGILDQLEAVRTGEMGFKLEDHKSHSYGLLRAGGISPTGTLELMRGDLTDILYKAADQSANVTYRFETTVQRLQQMKDKVIVELEDSTNKTTATEEFDFVVGADGINSNTRKFVMGPPEQIECFHPVGAFVAYFSIPKEEQDWPYSRLCHFRDRRVIATRPIRKDANTTSACFICLKKDIPALSQANAEGDRVKQKQAFAELYKDLGWETPRIIEQMMKADNFYSDELMQVKLPKWSQDRVVLLGDAAWAPCPFTGQGNQLAIIGAWVLAQEMSRNRGTAAFDMYEKRLRPYVEKCQNIPLGGYGPSILIPQTRWGICVLRTVVLLASWMIRLGTWLRLPTLLPDRREEDNFDLEIEGPITG